MVVKYLLSLWCVTVGLSAAVSNKTVIDTVPHIPASALTSVPLKFYLQERPGVSGPFKGSKLDFHFDYASSLKDGAYAQMASPFGDGKVAIETADSLYSKTFNDFEFIHRQGGDHGISGILSLNPYFKKITVSTHFFLPLKKWLPNFFAECDVAFSSLNSGVKLGASGPETSRELDGKKVSIADYFSGHFEQRGVDGSTERQRLLEQATFGHRHSKKGLSDVAFTFGYKKTLGKESFFAPYAKMIFAPDHQRKSNYLCDVHLSEYPYHAFLGGFEAVFSLSKKQYSDLFCALVGEVGLILPHSQIRVLGFKDQNLAPVPWSYFRLLGTQGAPGVTPAANLLTKKLSIGSRTFGNASFILDGRFSSLDLSCGYHVNAFERETVSYNDVAWKDDLYAVPTYRYDSLANFDAATDALYGAHTFITSDGLDFSPATAEGFLAHTISLGLALSGVVIGYHLRVAGGWTFTFASPTVSQAWSSSAGIFISF